jgi:hypothetical protein
MIAFKSSAGLSMGFVTARDNILLTGSVVDGSVFFGGASVNGVLDLQRMSVGGDVSLSGASESPATFGQVDLTSAKVAGQLLFDGANVRGQIQMPWVQVDGQVTAVGTQLVRMNARGAWIGGQMDLTSSRATALYLETIDIGRDLRLAKSILGSVFLSGSSIRGSLDVRQVSWEPKSAFVLRDVHSGTVDHSAASWPRILELNGFTYNRMQAHADGSDVATSLGGRWYTEWLDRQHPYSPEAHEQLAGVLERAGAKDSADEVRYASKEHERGEAAGFRWAVLNLERMLIGYGYRIHRAIYWVGMFVVLGAAALRWSGQGAAHGMPYGIAYSLDMLIPVVRLREYHHKVELHGWARYYFYVHILAGYVLASFLIAGLAGLTKG